MFAQYIFPPHTATATKRPITALLMLALTMAMGLSASAQYKVVHMEKPFNTPGSETAAIEVGDTVLVYASMQNNLKKNRQFSFSTQLTQLYQARISRNGKIARPRPCRWGLNSPKQDTGNLALDPWTHDIYFTHSDLETHHTEIFFARKLKRGWSKPSRLRGAVNMKDYSATQPTVGRLPDSSVILYFSSDRPGGQGGMDIWYSIVKNGTSGECVNLGPNVNSTADEITPFYDQRNEVLYFSSDRAGGQGGHDIYTAVGSRNTWQKAEAVCGCLNSEQNDIYFTITHYDTASGMPIRGYLSSNRSDSYFLVDSTCCNDIYRWGIDSNMIQYVSTDTIAPPDTVEREIRRFMFPLFLYFHNDEPDPRNNDTITTIPYTECQQHLLALRDIYVEHQTTAEDSTLTTEFFDSCVEGNYRRVEQLFDYIESLLDDGHHITLTIAGYASPVFRSDYNQRLSQRRISSFINMIKLWRNGLFNEAMADGKLEIRQKPHGAIAPTTASQSADPVYGLPAALARRIEILGCEIR